MRLCVRAADQYERLLELKRFNKKVISKYKYYVSGHYPSSCLYLKTRSCLFLKTTFRRLDSVSVFR
jgi:putative component of membrane protein insertase Oxa1/YidC/SpoIIIJ protein YidD